MDHLPQGPASKLLVDNHVLLSSTMLLQSVGLQVIVVHVMVSADQTIQLSLPKSSIFGHRVNIVLTSAQLKYRYVLSSLRFLDLIAVGV